MISVEEFASLNVGDLIETEPMFKALSKEPIVLRVATDGADAKDFVATYMGVALGRWRAKREGKRLSWAFNCAR
jgi:hypothetical protein